MGNNSRHELKISEEDIDKLAEIIRASVGDVSGKENRVLPKEKTTGEQEKSAMGYVPSGRDKDKKKKVLSELDKELVTLGMTEGNVTECKSPDTGDHDSPIECRGVLRKRIKTGLIMEYTFSSPYGGVKNFHLNNTLINFEEMDDEKLSKLLVVIKLFNKEGKERDKDNELKMQEMISEEEESRKEREKKEANKRKLVLGKL